jgi:hypothetical protein
MYLTCGGDHSATPQQTTSLFGWLSGISTVGKGAFREGAPLEDADPGHPPGPVRPGLICRDGGLLLASSKRSVKIKIENVALPKQFR